jgi:hypothetical protein
MMNFELVLFKERSSSRPPAGGSGSYVRAKFNFISKI